MNQISIQLMIAHALLKRHFCTETILFCHSVMSTSNKPQNFDFFAKRVVFNAMLKVISGSNISPQRGLDPWTIF